MSDADKEIQKTLEEMNKRMADFQSGGARGGAGSFGSSGNQKIKIILITIAVAGLLAATFYYALVGYKVPPTRAVINPYANQTR